eukprot:COSAG03_NODE_9078_length_747_cov_1.103395_2_plen_68_part_01
MNERNIYWTQRIGIAWSFQLLCHQRADAAYIYRAKLSGGCTGSGGTPSSTAAAAVCDGLEPRVMSSRR